MNAFADGFEFFAGHAGDFIGLDMGAQYVNTVNAEIDALVEHLENFNGFKSSVDTLKGDVAEFWHADTFNINAAVRGSSNRVQVDRSHDFGSADITGKNFDAKYGLKYYKTGTESAKQQAKSVFQAFNHYKERGGKESLDEYLKNRGYQDDSVLHDPVYAGQIRIIPSDQMNQAIKWLERKIASENRPEQVKRYQETLSLLRDRLRDNKGNESIPLSEEDARRLARLAKEGGVDPKELGLSTEQLIQFEYLLKQAFKSGLTSATISLVLKTAPEIFNAIKYLIENGEIEEGEFKRIGFAALNGASEGFVRGTISASITVACKSGLLGTTLKSLDPTVIGAVTVLTMDTIKNAYKVSTGKMTRYEMSNDLIRGLFTSTCALVGGAIGQSFIEIPVLGFMLGSFVGSLAGSFAFSAVYQPAISFCVDTGFTMFGIVNQDYSLPEDVMEEIGVDVFEYEKFDYAKFEPKSFSYRKFSYDSFEPVKLDMTFLRRGVIGINEIGFV